MNLTSHQLGNAGIGASIVKALAAHNPACVYLCARTPSKAQTLIESINKDNSKAKIEPLELDLNSFESIRACAKKFDEMSDRLDRLYLNAGISGTVSSLLLVLICHSGLFWLLARAILAYALH